MKINLMQDYRKYFTLEDIDSAKEFIKEFNESYDSGKNDLEKWEVPHFAEAVLTSQNDHASYEILSAKAEVCKYIHSHNDFNDHSGEWNIFLTIKIQTLFGFYEASAYVTNIWNYRSGEPFPGYVKAYKAVR